MARFGAKPVDLPGMGVQTASDRVPYRLMRTRTQPPILSHSALDWNLTKDGELVPQLMVERVTGGCNGVSGQRGEDSIRVAAQHLANDGTRRTIISPYTNGLEKLGKQAYYGVIETDAVDRQGKPVMAYLCAWEYIERYGAQVYVRTDPVIYDQFCHRLLEEGLIPSPTDSIKAELITRLKARANRRRQAARSNSKYEPRAVEMDAEVARWEDANGREAGSQAGNGPGNKGSDSIRRAPRAGKGDRKDPATETGRQA